MANFPIRISGHKRPIVAAVLALLLAGCALTPETPVEEAPESATTAPATATTTAAEAEQLRRQQAAEAEERARRLAEADLERQAELARQQAEAEREAEEERQRVAEQQRLEEEQRLAREQAERVEQERLAAIAAERQARLDQIAELESRIAELQAEAAAGDALNETIREAVLVSEQLLAALTEEQARYEESNLDAAGNFIDPPATEAITELESRRDSLLEQIDVC